jgi:hypothetical protein
MKSMLVLALSLAALTSCGDKGGGTPGDIPEALRGAYGQNEAHARMATVGLELDANALRYGELTLTVIAGERMANGDYLVKAAEAVWEKDQHPARKCHGTISRQDDTLFVKLYREGSDQPCESALGGDWRAWTKLDAVPEALRGTYGGDARSSDADIGMRLTDAQIVFTDGGDAVALAELVVWDHEPQRVIVRSASYRGFACSGSIVRVDEKLTLALEPGTGAPEDATCPNGSGVLWTVDPAHLPATMLDNGKVELVRDGEELVLSTADEPGLRCRQRVLRTSARSVTGSANDGIPVTGGAVIVLEHALPSAGAQGCTARLVRLAQAECGGAFATPCEQAAELATNETIVCPRQLVVGDPIQGGRKAALLPATMQSMACWDMSGVFAAPSR